MTTTPLREAERSTDMTAPADSEQELLDQLLKRGLEFGGTTNEDDVQRKRKLLEVVFNACISKPIESPNNQPTQVNLERAQLTLSILARQVSSLPEVLLCSSTADDSGTRPLYAWLITRIIVAVTHYEEHPEAAGLVDALCKAAVHILVVLGRDLSSGENTYMRGPQRVANILRELRTYGRGKDLTLGTRLTQDSLSTLLGYTDMPTASDSLPHLFAIHIALQTPGPYACDTELSAAVILSDMGKKITQQSPARQARYASVVAAALQTVPIRHVLARASSTIVQWSEVDDEQWQTSVRDFLRAVEIHGDESIRRDVWWALHDQAESLQLDSPVSRQKILHLLNPVAPHLTPHIIGSILSQDTIRRWSSEATGNDNADVRERLRQHCDIPSTSSLKRKRQDSVKEAVRSLLHQMMPDLPADVDIVENLPQALTTWVYIVRI